MALRHAVLAALLDGEFSGYELAKSFDIGVANFWHASPQQLYTELAKLEREGLVEGRQVVQEARPNKRLFQVTDAGRAELEAFAAAAVKPSVIRDDLLVKVQTADRIGTAPVIAQLEERAAAADAKIDLLGRVLRKMRGDLGEEEFLLRGDAIGGYLTCLRGIAFEQGHRDWCRRSAAILREREGLTARADEH
ncbi:MULTISPECIES: PadR family transcriptional regulator [Streptomyces]|uniref:PadR family transcriptional regulator n=1 Tax=Streptomyces virginiae TaxID=1961 RepID=A0ABQ3NVM1_STRVG|nr:MULTISPECIES: PadR family transcriptional regulator [Streptomyces]KOU14028.1 PadR family transcriptional regulator [Streptomyces sp. WM6349]KOU81760.1 PadR family transcriptional regulator [Streptomyces sp. XY593]KOU93060.1 PadR family transcriptional regulator [Streptomyces sp. XY533]KOV00444.1 PadR family transcriptional regulator [Streptomyces sp. XY511]KOV40884.1 PadR family transcriptional regulator [Streptomyces sp. H036]